MTPPYNIEGLQEHTTESGIRYYIISEGKGNKPNQYDLVKCHYELYVNDRKLDSSFDRQHPLEVRLGRGMVISGFEEILSSFNMGTQLVAIIPPSLGYGVVAEKDINDKTPPLANKELTFHINLIGILTIMVFSRNELEEINNNLNGSTNTKLIEKIKQNLQHLNN